MVDLAGSGLCLRLEPKSYNPGCPLSSSLGKLSKVSFLVSFWTFRLETCSKRIVYREIICYTNIVSRKINVTKTFIRNCDERYIVQCKLFVKNVISSDSNSRRKPTNYRRATTPPARTPSKFNVVLCNVVKTRVIRV